MRAGKALASTAVDVLTKPEVLRAAKEEFRSISAAEPINVG